MPVECEIQFPRLDTEEMRATDYRVMSDVFATHSAVGCLADESVYQRELLRRLALNKTIAEIEVPVLLSFRTFSVPLKLDLVVSRKVIYELKAVSRLNRSHEAQLMGYLYLTNSAHGKLINFRPRSVRSQFVNSTLDATQRRRFDSDFQRFDGPEDLRLMAQELVADWGTGLDASLYRRAILHCNNQNSTQEHLLPMTSSGESLGRQRFHLIDSQTAIGVTTYKQCKTENYRDFEKLIAFSPLKRLHWINITHHRLLLTTIHRR